MKPFMITVGLALLVVFSAIAQVETATAPGIGQPTMKCTGRFGRACTQQEISHLSQAVAESGRTANRATLGSVKTVSLALSDGTLQCVQNSLQKCSAQQAKELARIGAAMNV